MSSKQPEFGGASGDVGSTIVSVLEVAESDFTTLSWRVLLARCAIYLYSIVKEIASAELQQNRLAYHIRKNVAEV